MHPALARSSGASRAAALVLLGLVTGTRTVRADILFVSSFNAGTVLRYDLPSPNGTVVLSGLTNPEDGVCSPRGFIYFAESLSDRMGRWLLDGSGFTAIVPSVGAAPGVEGMSLDPAGNLYLNTRERNGVTFGAFRLDGANPANSLTQIAPPFTTFGEGSCFVLAGPHAGALLLVDRARRRVMLAEPPGAPLQVIVDSPAFPADVELYGVETNGCGDIFVAASSSQPASSAIYHFDPRGAFVEIYASGLASATHMEFDSAGTLYVGDSSANQIVEILPDRTKRVFATQARALGIAICRTRPVPPCPGPLAVEFSSFEVSCDPQGVRIAWTTAMEEDTSHFVVRRAEDPEGEGAREVAIPYVEARGPGHPYEVVDTTVRCGSGRTYYYLVEEFTTSGPGSRSPLLAARPEDPGVETLAPGGARSRRNHPR